MLPGFFDITPVELGQLGPEPAVHVLREMILAEAGNLGIPISEIDVPYYRQPLMAVQMPLFVQLPRGQETV